MNSDVTLSATENTDGTAEAASPAINSATAKIAEERGDYPGEGIIAASEQWKNDPVETYLRWLRSRDESLPAELPESDRLAKIGVLSEMEHLIQSEPHKINAKDPRLKKSERAKLQARQRDFFRDEALNIISWAVASSNADKTPFDWAAVSKMFYELEKTFDFFFYDTGVVQTDGDSQADIQAKVDARLATRQKALAATLWELDSGLATRYVDVLRGITMPLGLSDIEKRGPFLRGIERLEGVDPSAKQRLLSISDLEKKRDAGRAKGQVQNESDKKKLVREYRSLCKKYADKTKDGWMGKSWCASEVARHAQWLNSDANRYLLANSYPGLTADAIKGLAGEKRKAKG